MLNDVLEYGAVHFHHIRDTHPVPAAFGRHYHDEYEVIYVVEGKGRYVVEGTAYEMRDHTLMIFRPHEFHYVDISRDHVYERYVVQFGRDALLGDSDLFLRFAEDRCDGEGNFYASPETIRPVLSILERWSVLPHLPKERAELMVKLLLGELLVLLSSSAPLPYDPANDPLGAKVIRYLNKNITEPLSLDALAKHFYVSKYYLCRAFKEHNGISIVGYVNSKRVMLAKEWIERGETASNAAFRVGFGDYSSFFRAYKKTLGHAPKKILSQKCVDQEETEDAK